ncbi:hypothetical protein Tco_0381375, partial [Tanacetum coccineum]
MPNPTPPTPPTHPAPPHYPPPRPPSSHHQIIDCLLSRHCLHPPCLELIRQRSAYRYYGD